MYASVKSFNCQAAVSNIFRAMWFEYLVTDFWTVWTLWSISLTSCVKIRTPSSEEELHRMLLENYSNLVMPREATDPALNVTLAIFLQLIVNLDENNESFEAKGWLYVKWNDFRLTWNSSLYRGRTSTILPAKLVWKPDLYIYNTVDEIAPIANEDMNLKIMNNGSIIWEPGVSIHTSCSFDVTAYPFDSQNCILELGSWYYELDEIVLHISNERMPLIAYKEHSQWEIYNISTKTTSVMNKFSTGVCRIFLRRRRLFYVLNIVLPILVTSSLNAFVFVLPAESGEKIGLSTTLFLTHAVLLGSISRDIPSTSTSTSILGAFVVLQLILNALSILVTTIMLNYYYGRANKMKSSAECSSDRNVKPTDCKDITSDGSKVHTQYNNMKSEISLVYRCFQVIIVNWNMVLFCITFLLSVGMATVVICILIFRQ